METHNVLARRQHEHRERTVVHLAAVADTGLLPAELQEMAVPYRAEAERELGRTEASRQGMQLVVDGSGRLAPPHGAGLAHLARLAGDLPTARDVAGTLGWPGRHHRLKSDVWWVQGDMAHAAAATRPNSTAWPANAPPPRHSGPGRLPSVAGIRARLQRSSDGGSRWGGTSS
ncbi:hypothetical protein ACWCQN_45050 [Streptomyces sp. NPDC001984]|uniref:hypothetical protein n=1 Tax=Streptomyces sp. NPDC002619 TaxID=3364655 RepID=UPI00368A1BB7